MILKSISLRNYRKFKDAFLEFPDGVTGIVGLNGVGKSTLFEALAWVLYGPVAARTGVDQIKREGAAPSDPCRVEIEFIFDEDTYRVVREMTGKNLSATGIATVNGKIAANGAEPVSRFIQKKLGMDWKSFYTSIFAKQKELNTLSSMNPSERRQLILRMLGIDAVDDIISKIRSDAKEKKSLVEKLGGDLFDAHGVQKTIALTQELQSLEKKQKDLEKHSEGQKKKRITVETAHRIIKKDYETKRQTYETLCATKEQLEEKKSRFEKKHTLAEDISAMEKTFHERAEFLKKHTEKLTVFKNLEKDLRTLEQQQEKNQNSLQSLIKKQEQNRTVLRRLEEDVKDLMVKRQSIEKMGADAKCPTCERVLGEQRHKLLSMYSEDLTKKNQEKQRLAETGKTLTVEYERLSREKQALQKKNTYLRSQVVDRERLQTTILNSTMEFQREENKLDAKKKEYKALGAIEFDEKQYQLIRTRVSDAYRSYQVALEKLDDIKEQQQEITLEQKDIEADKNLITQQRKMIQKNIEEQQRLKKRLEEEQKNAFRLGMLSEVMDSYRTYLISQIRPTLSAHASELFDELTDGKYSQIELDEDYNLLVYDQGQPYRIERFSGGEEDLANLCIRMAISEIITERAGSIFNVIILDEIFGSQDQIRKQNIIKALNGFSSKFRQIFLITHVEDIKHLTEHTVIVSEDESGVSFIKIE
jgi:exonuclease SbcC